MSEKTKIQWCDDTHNFWRGCVKVSPGCAHCYAEVSTPVRVARSEGRELWGGTLRDRARDFEAPLRWNEKPWVCDLCGHTRADAPTSGHAPFCEKAGSKTTFHRRRVFSLSLGDWLDEAVPIEWLVNMLDVIRRCPNLYFLLLTKRPENWNVRLLHAAMWAAGFRDGQTIGQPTEATHPAHEFIFDWAWHHQPPANVWIGATVENQEYADKRIPELLKIPAVCRFISYEPALGPVEFSNVTGRSDGVEQLGKPALAGIHWIIVGGESGPEARPFNIEWARSTVKQCQAAGVACFVKQMGARPWGHTDRISFKHSAKFNLPKGPDGFYRYLNDRKHGGDITEFPADLRVRQFPNLRTWKP